MPQFLLALTPRVRARRRDARSDVRGAQRRRRTARRDARARDVRVAAGRELAHPADGRASGDRRVAVGQRGRVGRARHDRAPADHDGGEVRMFARALCFGRRALPDQRGAVRSGGRRADPGRSRTRKGCCSACCRSTRRGNANSISRCTPISPKCSCGGSGRSTGSACRCGPSSRKLPMWLALWVVWVSLIIVANYYSDRLGELRGHKNEGKKK